jgi:hypothetical protein
VIPCLLAQADGISQEIVGGKLFTSRKKKLDSSVALEKLLLTYQWCDRPVKLLELQEMMLNPLRRKSGLQVDTRDRDAGTSPEFSGCTLNRHGVLHGTDLNYGTEANALRAWVLLDYLQHVKGTLTSLASDKQRWDKILLGSATQSESDQPSPM